MFVRFWGTRGSIAVPGEQTTKFGGNTACVEVRTDDGTIIVLDCGTGVRELGHHLLQAASQPLRLHLFIGHTHWDHIQGFPFFVPAYVPGFSIAIYGAKGFGKDLESIFRGQLDRDYFPVQLDDMRSSLAFHHLPPEPPLIFGDVKISWQYAHHPLPAVGYKIEIAGRKIAWVPDDEFLQGYTGRPDALSRDDPGIHLRQFLFVVVRLEAEGVRRPLGRPVVLAGA